MPQPRATVPTLFAVLAAVALLPAQEPAAVPGPASPAAADAPAASADGADEIEYVRAADGRLIPVIPGERWARFEEWLARQARPNPAETFQIRSLALEGRSDDERALLTATVDVSVLVDEQWVEVPLRLSEAILREAPQLEHPDDRFVPADRDGGYRCLMRGKGDHRLTLSLVVPLTRRLPGRRLQLSLPQEPQSVSSSLRLFVPIPHERLSVTSQPADVARPPVIQTEPAEDGTQLVGYGLGDRLDLTWQELPGVRQETTPLQAETAMRLTLTSDAVLLGTVSQRIQSLQGTLSQLRVRLPAGFELLRLNVGQQEYKSPESDPGPLVRALGAWLGGAPALTGGGGAARAGLVSSAPHWVVIRLPAPATGADLTWEVRSALPADRKLRLGGFQVAEALREAGTVRVESDEGYQLTKESGDDVYQVGVATPADGGRVAKEFAFRRQPFQLVLGLQEVEPYCTVEPHYFLRLAGDRIDLMSEFHFAVHRGALQDVQLHWPGSRSEEWTIAPAEQSDLVEQIRTDGASGSIHIRLLQRQSKGDEFRLVLRAHRQAPPDGTPASLTLPTPDARRLQSLLVLAEADEIDANLSGAPGTVLRPVPGRRIADATRWLAAAELPDDEWLRLRRSVHSLETSPAVGAHALQVELTRHAPQLTCECEVTARWVADRIDVTQVLHYDVSHAEQSQVRLGLPDDVPSSVRFAEITTSGEELRLEASGDVRPAPGGRRIWLTLSEGRRGRFDLVARYTLEIPDELRQGLDGKLTIPLIQSPDATPRGVRAGFESAEAVEAAVTGTGWTRQPGVERADEWFAAQAMPSVVFAVRRAERYEASRFSIIKALVRTACLPDGHAQSRACYRVAGHPTVLRLTLPPDSLRPDGFWWDRQELRPTSVDESTGEYVLELPGPPDGADHLLTVDYHTTAASTGASTREHRLAAPQWPSDVWIAQGVWEVTLPGDQHLFTQPDQFAPRFSWQRGTVFWHRAATPGYADLHAWIGTDQGPEERSDFGGGNSYVFSRVGALDSMTFRSMNRSVVVLLGAGLALAAGFILLRIPATRHVMTLLAVALAVAVVGLWYPAPVQLLLQPALLGLLLASMAAWMDGTLSRRRAPAPLSLSSPSDYLPPSSHPSNAERGHGAVGSEDPTALRPPIAAEAVGATSTVSGHGR